MPSVNARCLVNTLDVVSLTSLGIPDSNAEQQRVSREVLEWNGQ